MSNSKIISLADLKGKLAKLSQGSFKKLGDFLFYEGPIISHFVSLDNEDFIMKWSDQNDEVNRWMLYKMNHKLLHQFFNGQISDFELLQKTSMSISPAKKNYTRCQNPLLR